MAEDRKPLPSGRGAVTKSYYPSKRSSAFMNAGEPRTYTEAEAQAIIDAAVAAALAAANGEAESDTAPRQSLADKVRQQFKLDESSLVKTSHGRVTPADRILEMRRRGML